MKINGIDNGTSPVIPMKKGGKDEANGIDFQKILKEARSNLDGLRPDVSPKTSVERPEILPTSSLSINLLSELGKPFPVRNEGIQAAEDTLILLDQYQKALADPHITLKEINPLVQALGQEVKNIIRVSEKLSSADPLQKIMEEVGVISAVEIEKFNRGEYI
ncbi:MAG: hypothetical protein FJ117_17805 [Deltaproteobacteria bacterium]|nr:hypothetical protein [Deltaproteobacteria bacterium]